jgi:hypothetical protein
MNMSLKSPNEYAPEDCGRTKEEAILSDGVSWSRDERGITQPGCCAVSGARRAGPATSVFAVQTQRRRHAGMQAPLVRGVW